ncbi:hypothetical protein ACFFK0_28050 [Paenibacillus chartarius]|uniref:Amino acid ABC transporter ATP-binding protein n=1 Tax=Paenibacillus chartarius TaxID=747481 RepID=A0ABV6DUB5_9BACL
MEVLSPEGMTQIIITHEMEFAHRAADRIIFMDRGSIAEAGTPEDKFGGSRNERLQSWYSRFR